MMQMNGREWMYGDRRVPGTLKDKFIDVATANKNNGCIRCPCVQCRNNKEYSSSKIIRGHLIMKGFMPNYNCWTKHGERGVMMEDGEEEDDDNNYHHMFPEYSDTAMEDNGEERGEERASDEPADELGRVISDAKRDCETENEKLKLEGMLEDHKKLLYPNCENGNTKLGITLELLRWKAECGLTDSSFEKMLKIYPTADDTLESRRSRVQSKWFNTIPYTWKVLLQKLLVLCGDSDFEVTGDFKTGYTLYIDTDLELYGQVEELENIINTMIPENLVVVSKNSIPCNIKGAVLFGGGICFINEFIITNDFREVFDVNGSSVFGGGIVQTEMLNITNDSQETVSVQGTVNFGGKATDTAMVTISTDFNETIRADMDAKAASGVVQVDFIEIKTT